MGAESQGHIGVGQYGKAVCLKRIVDYGSLKSIDPLQIVDFFGVDIWEGKRLIGIMINGQWEHFYEKSFYRNFRIISISK
jgi:hypothetical protein